MYHFKETDHAANTLVLDDHIELSGCAVRYLKDFQICAVRFLYGHFCKRQFCILNDESGLGKTATAAVLMGIVATKRNCLIVVSNKDSRVTNWRFHFNILTDLNVSVLDEEKDYNEDNSTVYIAKWNSLRMISDLSKFRFDIVILDNRDEMLSNTFCTSTLLKSFERKVQLVISSIDVTSDVKLLHNILRLGGHLEHQFESWKTFEEKYHLPDLKAISNNKSNLNEYFLKREILSDYCRDFRLRRYRHQYEHMLPLVDPERYKAHLAHWSETAIVKKTSDAVVITDSMQTEIGTEELLEQYLHRGNPNLEADEEVQQITKNMDAIAEKQIRRTSSVSNDDELNMSPLVYQSESENSDNEVVLLSSNSIEAVIPIIEIDDGDEEVVKCATSSLVEEEQISNLTNKNNSIRSKNHVEKKKEVSKETDKERHVKILEKKTKATKEAKDSNETKELLGSNKKRTRRKNAIHLEESDTLSSRRTLRNKGSLNVKKSCNAKDRDRKDCDKRVESNKNSVHIPSNGTESKDVIKSEKLSPLKRKTEKKSSEKTVITKVIQSPSDGIENLYSADPNGGKQTKDKKKSIPVQEQNNSTPSIRRARANISKSTLGVPHRETRNTKQRVTRSAGKKRKCFALEFDDDKKTKTRSAPKRTSTAKQTIKKNTPTKDIKLEDGPKTSRQKKATPSKTNTATSSKSSQSSTQGAKLPSSSDYEEIQCGQQMASSDNSPQIPEKLNEFLMPSTPPSLRLLQSSLLQPSSITPFTQLDKEINTDVVILSNGINNAMETVLVPSSQDETSLSSQGSFEKPTANISGTRKRKRYSKRVSIKEPAKLGYASTKQRGVAQSPDLFSTGSDIACSNVIPFTQIHCASETPSTSSTSFGFKIFGSEVRRQQDIATSNESSQRPSRGNRSCLNILEQMFEKNNPTPLKTSTQQIGALKGSKSETQKTKGSTKTPVVPRKPIHELNQQADDLCHQTGDITSDDIFEITNNATFGSTLRINACGNISPVQQQLSFSQHHNKITNYLIGNGSTKPNSSQDDEHQILGTPSKRLPMSQLPGSGSIQTTAITRKSPKSLKTTQSTKLTKWFRRSSVDDTMKSAKDSSKGPKAVKTTKRRRLDLSFKS